MKIIFLCGSLQAGRDGVGDYTRRLAAELIRQGHEAEIIALRDKEAVDEIHTVQGSEGVDVSVLRLPLKLNDGIRYAKAANYIAGFDPDWVSLQYVPFSFHNKGLPMGLGKNIKQLAKGRKLHIMFHELWVGRSASYSFKLRVLSYLQQFLLKGFVKLIRPAMVHTHLPVYQANLKHIGIVAKALPLFSNINVSQESFNEKPAKTLILAFFSQVDYSIQLVDFINIISTSAKAAGLFTSLVFIGGDERKMTEMAGVFRDSCPQLVSVSRTGFLNEGMISEFLSNCDMGISAVPQHLLGKSGSIAAFLAHGVPVAAPISDKEYTHLDIGFFDPSFRAAIVTSPDYKKLKAAQEAVLIVQQKISVVQICHLFCSDLLTNLNKIK